MNTNSNSYTIIYASVLVVIVAFLLAFVSSVLEPVQKKNVDLDKKKQILAALNIRDLGEPSVVEEKYNEVVIADMVINAAGEVKQEGTNKDQDGFKVENKEMSAEKLPVYICSVDGEKKYVVPVSGRGLWGGLWGYISVNEDCTTVYGAYFSHESETAGLGSPIAEQKFQDQFKGKKLYAGDDQQQVALTVVKKGQVKNTDIEVDGLTGATLTTKGAAAMVTDGLQQYINFFHANNK